MYLSNEFFENVFFNKENRWFDGSKLHQIFTTSKLCNLFSKIVWLHNEFKHSNKSNPFIRGNFHLIRHAYQVIGNQSVEQNLYIRSHN
jgi:hypothetical protein